MKNTKIGKDKYINTLLRFKNTTWTTALIIQIVNFVIFLIRAFGGNIADNVEETVASSAQVAALIIAGAINHFMDPTTQGLSDSERNLAKNKVTTNGSESLNAMSQNGDLINQNNETQALGGGGEVPVSPQEETPEYNVDVDPQYNPDIKD